MATRTKGRGGVRSAAGAPGARNYMTPRGYGRLKAELAQLLDHERPELVKVIAWAASNGDRSENGDYIYGKRRLREIDRRIHYLTKRLDVVEVVDPAAREATDRVYFGATVTYRSGNAQEGAVTIVGIDEADAGRGHVSWISPIARAMLGRTLGDAIKFTTPSGEEEIEITDVRYDAVH
ncbi:MAG: transcription elongation factor GreB [Betaproteobacteria bacterium]|nr:transcription elongation factor GreB [Betaproteobacteria bacterium]